MICNRLLCVALVLSAALGAAGCEKIEQTGQQERVFIPEAEERLSGDGGQQAALSDRKPMIMIEGELYLDTGRAMPAEMAPSEILGTITSNVPSSELPTEDGQSNFNCIGAEYARSEDGIALKLNQQWWYFQKEEILGLQLDVSMTSPTGLTLVCIQSGGQPTGKLITGSYYWLEQERDGQWAEVEMKLPRDQVGWTDEAWMIEMDGRTEWKVDWEWLYGALEPGKYRIGKKVYDFREAGDYDTYIYYGVFMEED